MIRTLGLGLALWLALTALPAAAADFTIVDLGLDVGHTCPQALNPCSENKDFLLDGVAPAAGTITFDSGANQVSILLTVASASMLGSFDGVNELLLTDLVYEVSNWSVAVFGGTIFGLGSPVGSVSGTLEQLGSSPVAAQPFAVTPTFSSLVCPADGTGQCGFTVGFAGNFVESLGNTGGPNAPHRFVHTFNVVVTPEPASAALLALGLLVLARRNRS